MNISANGKATFVLGPLPAASEAPRDSPQYSGLLECPMTTRITKVLDGTYQVKNAGGCTEQIMTFQECFHAAALFCSAGELQNTTGSDQGRPSDVPLRSVPHSTSCECVLQSPCQLVCTLWRGSEAMAGATDGLVYVGAALDTANGNATLTLRGPSDVWFGAGFGATSLADQPWTVVADGNGAVNERKLGEPSCRRGAQAVGEGGQLFVSNGLRTVVLYAARRGAQYLTSVCHLRMLQSN